MPVTSSLPVFISQRIQLAVPKLVAIAVRMVITTCTTVFHVSLFIVLPFLFSFFHFFILSFFISHLSPSHFLTFSLSHLLTSHLSPPLPPPYREGRGGSILRHQDL